MYIIDGKRMENRQKAHDELMRSLELPEYYGRNLDALWDVLMEKSGDILLTDMSDMLSRLEGYGFKLLQTLREAAEKNPNLTFRAE